MFLFSDQEIIKKTICMSQNYTGIGRQPISNLGWFEEEKI